MFIKTGKDRIERSSRYNVVYKIDCNDCEVSYVGQTKRRLTTRIREHRNDINKKSGIPSVISTHRLQDHDFDWNNIHILDNEPSWYKRIISEMIHIKTQSNELNKQSDTEILSDSYNHTTFKIGLSLEPSDSSLICFFQSYSFPFLCLVLLPFIFKYHLLFVLLPLSLLIPYDLSVFNIGYRSFFNSHAK